MKGPHSEVTIPCAEATKEAVGNFKTGSMTWDVTLLWLVEREKYLNLLETHMSEILIKYLKEDEAGLYNAIQDAHDVFAEQLGIVD